MLQEIVDDLLFGLGVQSTDIEGDQFELLPVGPCIGAFPVDVWSFSIGQRTLPIFSVCGSVPLRILLSSLGFLLLLRILLLLLSFFFFWWVCLRRLFLLCCSCMCRVSLFGSPLLLFWCFPGSHAVSVGCVGVSSVEGDLLLVPFLFSRVCPCVSLLLLDG